MKKPHFFVQVFSLAVILLFLVLGGTPPGHAQDAGATFIEGPALNVARGLHHTAILPDGTVAVFGGYGGYYNGVWAPSPNSAEFWNPDTNKFTLKNMSSSHYAGAFARMGDGRYLLAGGYTNGGDLATAEIFDPADRSFTPTTGNMTVARSFFSAATLTSGKVLLVGRGADYGDSFDPGSGTFTATESLNTSRETPVILPTNDGKAVVLGGYDAEQVELYDPATNSFNVLQPTLFSGESGWQVYGDAVEGMFPRSIETQKLSDGRYLLLARKLIDQTHQSYQNILFTFDPASKQIAKINVSPALPTSYGQWNYWWPVVVPESAKAFIITDQQILTVDLKTGNRNTPKGYYGGSFRLNAHPAVVYLSGRNRLFLTGGYGYPDSLSSTNSCTTRTLFAAVGGSVAPHILLLLLQD